MKAKIRATVPALRAHERRVARRGTNDPKPGELVLLRRQPGRDLIVYWLVTHLNPDDEDLLFAVFVDDLPASVYCGPCDVRVRTTDGDELITRCGHGVWVKKARLVRRTAAIVGEVHPADLARVRRTLYGMVTGSLKCTARAREVDDDPEYEQHQATVARIRFRTWHR